MRTSLPAFLALILCVGLGAAGPAGLDPALQAKVDAHVKTIQAWASDPTVVAAVKSQNTAPPEDLAAMTEEKWATLSVLDPFVRGFSKNPVATLLKSRKTDVVSEVFVSAADGRKVAFLAKTTSWSHKGKPKHDLPMTGKVWQGEVEVDGSTGVQSVQVAVPVMDRGRPIGSLVVGLAVTKL